MTAEQDGGSGIKRNYYFTQQDPKDIELGSAQDNEDEIKVESSSENEIILIEESKDASVKETY